MKKKILSIVLSLCMTFALIPENAVKISAAEIIASGTSRDLEWTIDSDGLLTITGEGAFSPSANGPEWLDYADYIKSAQVNVRGITDTMQMFKGCYNMTEIDLSNFDTSNIKYMNQMFCGCSGLKSLDLSNFDTSNVRLMESLFARCSGLTELDLSNFDTSNVTWMASMFVDCSSLTKLDLSNFDTSNVTLMNNMFWGCTNLVEIDLSSFDTSNVTAISDMFRECSSLTKLDLSNFDTSNVTVISRMFEDCTNLANIKTPLNVSKKCSLFGETWKDINGNIYTELPMGLDYSIELTREIEQETTTVPKDETSSENETTTKNETPTKNNEFAQVENQILNAKNDKDPTGSTFGKLRARVKKATKKSNKVTWKKVKGATKYIIYGAKCGTKIKKLAEVKKTTYTQKKLKKGRYYKYLVMAVDGKDNILAISKIVHSATKGGKAGNAKKLKLNKSKVTLKKGNKSKLKVKQIVAVKKTKIRNHRPIYFESSNKKVATVTKKGVIKAKGKGTCTVFVYAQNGVYKAVKVKVK